MSVVMESKKSAEDEQEKLVLLKIKPGKPNRKSASPARVDQKAQKGSTCFYYALKTTAIDAKDYLERQVEKDRNIISNIYRKPLTKTSKCETLKTWLRQTLETEKLSEKQKILASLRKTIAQAKLKLGPRGGLIDKDPKLSFLFVDIEKLLNEFEKSSRQDIMAFVEEVHAHQNIEIYEKFLKALDLNPMEMALKKFLEMNNKQNFLEKIGLTEEDFGKLDPKEAKELFDNLRVQTMVSIFKKVADEQMCRIYGLEKTNWKPTDNILTLFNLIKNNCSPLVIGGFFGKKFYNEDPFAHDLTGYYDVFGWPSGSHKGLKCGGSAHAVSVIGVELNKDASKSTGFVYFIDSNDTSKVGEKRRAYKISYERFCEFSLDNHINCAISFAQAERPKEINQEVFDTHVRKIKASLDYGWQKPKKGP